MLVVIFSFTVFCNYMFTYSFSPWELCVIHDRIWKYFCFSFALLSLWASHAWEICTLPKFHRFFWRVTLVEEAYFWSSWALFSFITNLSLGSFFSWVTLTKTNPFFFNHSKDSFTTGRRTNNKKMMIMVPIIRKVFRCSTPTEMPASSRICPKCPKFNQVGDKSCLSTNTLSQAFHFIFRYLTGHLISLSSFSLPISTLR